MYGVINVSDRTIEPTCNTGFNTVKVPIRPKLTIPELLFHIGTTTKNLSYRQAFYYLDKLLHTV